MFPAKRGGSSSPRSPPSSRGGRSPDCFSPSHRRWCATSCTSGSAPQAVSASRCCSSPTARVDCGRRDAPREAPRLLGTVLLSLGAAGLAAALVFASPAVFIGASIVSGLGVGLTFNGTLRGISGATTPESRSEVFSAAFVISYAALGLPSLAAGLAAPMWGLTVTSYLYISFIAALSLSATLHAGRHLVPRPDQPRQMRLHSSGEATDRGDRPGTRPPEPLSFRETDEGPTCASHHRTRP